MMCSTCLAVRGAALLLYMKLKMVLQVEDVYFPKERATGRRRPFCFVTFALQKVLSHCMLTDVAYSVQLLSGYCVSIESVSAACFSAQVAVQFSLNTSVTPFPLLLWYVRLVSCSVCDTDLISCHSIYSGRCSASVL